MHIFFGTLIIIHNWFQIKKNYNFFGACLAKLNLFKLVKHFFINTSVVIIIIIELMLNILYNLYHITLISFFNNQRVK